MHVKGCTCTTSIVYETKSRLQTSQNTGLKAWLEPDATATQDLYKIHGHSITGTNYFSLEDVGTSQDCSAKERKPRRLKVGVSYWLQQPPANSWYRGSYDAQACRLVYAFCYTATTTDVAFTALACTVTICRGPQGTCQSLSEFSSLHVYLGKGASKSADCRTHRLGAVEINQNQNTTQNARHLGASFQHHPAWRQVSTGPSVRTNKFHVYVVHIPLCPQELDDKVLA